MTRNQISIGAGAVGFIICLGMFIVALSQQMGAIAALACLAAWLQLFIVIATAGDAMSNRQSGSWRGAMAGALVLVIALSYVIAAHRS